MTQFKLPLLAGLAAAAALSLGSPALAVTAAKPAAKAHPAAQTHPAAKGRMVTARQANGKTVIYNCSLPGNQTKQACKR